MIRAFSLRCCSSFSSRALPAPSPFEHVGFEKTYADRISLTYYEGGHMMYIRPNMLKALKSDMAQFIKRTQAGK